jgi:hypothetical protein
MHRAASPGKYMGHGLEGYKIESEQRVCDASTKLNASGNFFYPRNVIRNAAENKMEDDLKVIIQAIVFIFLFLSPP